MKCKVEFQYKRPGAARPEDAVQEEEIIAEHGESLPIPAVGDSVSYKDGDGRIACKVLTRHFSYLKDWCVVNIVVTNISGAEMGERLKE